MNINKPSLEARKALNEYNVEISQELSSGKELNNKELSNNQQLNNKQQLNDNTELNGDNQHLYNLRNNLTRSEDVTEQELKTYEKSRKNPNYSFSDFLGKGF